MPTDLGKLPNVGCLAFTRHRQLPVSGLTLVQGRGGWAASSPKMADHSGIILADPCILGKRIPAGAAPTTQASLAPGRSLLGTVADFVASTRIDLNLASKTTCRQATTTPRLTLSTTLGRTFLAQAEGFSTRSPFGRGEGLLRPRS